MAINPVCPQCGFENRSAGVFCSRCGARMGTPELRRKREPIRLFRILGILLKAAILIAVVGGLLMIIWPQSIPEVAPDIARAQRFQATISNLAAAVRQQATAAQVIADADINNYLAWRIMETEGADEASGSIMGLEGMYVTVSPALLRAIAVGSVGPLKLSYEIRGRPIVGRGRFSIDVRSAKIGHLPLPRAAAGFVAGRIEGVVGTLTEERMILDRVSNIELGESKARITLGR